MTTPTSAGRSARNAPRAIAWSEPNSDIKVASSAIPFIPALTAVPRAIRHPLPSLFVDPSLLSDMRLVSGPSALVNRTISNAEPAAEQLPPSGVAALGSICSCLLIAPLRDQEASDHSHLN